MEITLLRPKSFTEGPTEEMVQDLRKTLLFAFAVYLLTLSIAQFWIVARTSSLLPIPFAVGNPGPAEVSLSILDLVAIEFSVSALDFGFGFVNSTCSNCTMDVEGSGNADVSCCVGSWATPPSDGLLLENTGNINVNLYLNVSSTAASWIGGSNVTPRFQFKMLSESDESHAQSDGDDTTSSCRSGWIPSTFTEANTTGFYVCGSPTLFDFNSQDDRDEVHLVVRVVIPQDSSRGQKQVTFLALATAP